MQRHSLICTSREFITSLTFKLVIALSLGFQSQAQNNLIFYGGNGGGSTTICTILPVVLPIILTNFEVVCDNGNRLVTWETASELNTLKFEIEYSEDGLNWFTVGEKTAAIKSLIKTSYSYVLPYQINSSGYLRLKTLESTGEVTFSKIIVITNCFNGEIKMYPCPVTRILNIAIEEDKFNGKVEIRNMLGELINSYSIEKRSFLQVDMSCLPAGCYYIAMFKGERVVKTFKCIKMGTR